MFKRAIWVLAAAVCLAAPASVQAQGDYLDVYTVKVKPEKVADFQVLAKKWADANRKFNGEHYLAMETMYGEGGVYVFVSPRQDYAELEKADQIMMQAANIACGTEATEKIMRDWDSCLVWSRSELRRRRIDLSRKPPTNMDAYAQLIGESRVLRTTAVHVRPGHVAEFEALLREAKAASEQMANTQPLLISQSAEGTKGTIFYVTALRSSLGGFDKNPTMREVLGEEGYRKYSQVNAEAVEGTESALYRFSPALSSPTEEVAKVAADFWQPKTVMAAAASKPKAASAKTAEVKPTAEKPKK